jgi:pimeloyl-ACP methyl ester carboxylesterase
MRAWVVAGVLLVASVIAAPAASAATREARLALHVGRFDLRQVAHSRFVNSLNQALGDGCQIRDRSGALVVRFDLARLPRNCTSVSKAVRDDTAAAAPRATSAQASHYGLFLPHRLDPSRPLVLLVHGLDCDRANWGDMADLLAGEGHQVAYFNYPSDQPIADSATLLTRHVTSLHRQYPGLRIEMVAHSMGGLVSRAFVEGPAYCGGVERLILIGPPNHGSSWARGRMFLEFQEHYVLRRYDRDWSPTWMITDGLGEAGRDLRPGSSLWQHLNALPRREGVRYTIVAGSQSPTRRVAARCVETTSNLIAGRAAKWWGLRQCKAGLRGAADRLLRANSAGDGAVSVASAKLAGVEDFTVVPADHATLYFATAKSPPAAWPIVRDRLAR